MIDQNDTIRVFVPLAIKKRNGRPRIIAPQGQPPASQRRQQPHVLRAIGRAWSWRRKLESGEVSTVIEIAVHEGLNDSFVSRVIRLAYLSPAVLERLIILNEVPTVPIAELIGSSHLAWEMQSI